MELNSSFVRNPSFLKQMFNNLPASGQRNKETSPASIRKITNDTFNADKELTNKKSASLDKEDQNESNGQEKSSQKIIQEIANGNGNHFYNCQFIIKGHPERGLIPAAVL